VIKTFGGYVQEELRHRLSQLIDMGFHNYILTKCHGVVSQTYVGDITIVPNIPKSYYLEILTSTNSNFAENIALAGERATWPSIKD
jgi:hypothetical protein